MRWLTLLLVALVVALQYPLWLGKGSWLRVWDLDRQIAAQKGHNLSLTQRNASLDAEVRDLKQGYEAIEERARNELGMVRDGESFFQVLEANKPTPPKETAGKVEGSLSDKQAAGAEAPAKPAAPSPQPEAEKKRPLVEKPAAASPAKKP